MASDAHHVGDPNSWCGDDNLHLNDIGKLYYTAALTRAGAAC